MSVLINDCCLQTCYSSLVQASLFKMLPSNVYTLAIIGSRSLGTVANMQTVRVS